MIRSETYRQQLSRLVAAMSQPGREGETARDLANVSTPDFVRLFVDDNFEKRVDKLHSQLAFVGEAFADFDALIREFAATVPLAAYDSGAGDGERMLRWLSETKRLRLTPGQQDRVACQRARHAVENLARKHRLAHVRFQELASLADEYARELGDNPDLWLHLNPIRVWTRFVSRELLDEESEPPASVLFFAVRNDVSSAVLEDDGLALLDELAEREPCTLDQWAAVSPLRDRHGLVEFCDDLARMKLVALG